MSLAGCGWTLQLRLSDVLIWFRPSAKRQGSYQYQSNHLCHGSGCCPPLYKLFSAISYGKVSGNYI